MPTRLVSNLLALAAIACVATGVRGLFGIYVALIVLGVLLALIGWALSLQDDEVVTSPETNAVEAALVEAQLRHERELSGAVFQAEEAGRQLGYRQVAQELAEQQRLESLADELDLALS